MIKVIDLKTVSICVKVLQSSLTFTTLWANSEDDKLITFIFFLFFFPENMILFSGKNKKNITNMSSAELAQRVVKDN